MYFLRLFSVLVTHPGLGYNYEQYEWTAKMLNQLNKIAGSATRVMDLLTWLDTYHASDAAANRHGDAQQQRPALRGEVARATGASIKASPCIEFKDVTITTPTGRDLVRGLSFRVEHGESLLLTGHNGAGKSSIFRCLGGLWPIDRESGGQILKPGSGESEHGGLHADVFYLPQKPYSVLGTIFDQLT